MWSGLQDISSAALLNVNTTKDQHSTLPHHATTIDKIPDKVLLKIFSYLPHNQIGRMARVCKKWRMIAYDSRLWTHVSLRPEISGLHVTNLETLLALISIRFGTVANSPSLRYIELPMELITHTVLHELAHKCPNLTHMLLDFSTAMQLHDFNDLHSFPTKLRTMCICLSEVIFMEGFMRKIYNFINGLEVLHLVGTYEKAVEEEEEEIYEVINIHKLKSAVPNLRVVNLYGINFVDDSHVEAFSSNCIQLECLALNYCSKFTGSVLKLLLQRCKRLRCLLLPHTSLQSENVMMVEWEKTSLQELDITATELSSECLIDLLKRAPPLRYLSAGQQDGFNDLVLKEYVESGNIKNLIAFDVDRNENISEEMLLQFLRIQGPNLRGLQLSFIPHLTEQFWNSSLPLLKNMKILIMGMPEGCCQKVQSKVHIDSLMDGIANHCPLMERIEARWSSDTLRFSDRSSKAIDAIRIKCPRLRCLTLNDGKYFEMVKSNFERADRMTVVRSITNYTVTLVYLLNFYKDLIFN
ncbi:F-box/LRR-repeat protein 20-like protein [Dinothrombium tinctorium]|uniref:F-box/LRR-repeat protein 20-like protein n=1 Tax=Dinothrombium tinctorium TaxID=1965070 RepID=A0A443QW84_9ACAR|nr:F-box/LRR-repeat protein 20-like protein [Dinothrombium tinctorium]